MTLKYDAARDALIAAGFKPDTRSVPTSWLRAYREEAIEEAAGIALLPVEEDDLIELAGIEPTQPDADIDALSLRRIVTDLLSQLKPIEERIIRFTFFMGGTHAEAAELLGFSREKVRVIEQRALRRLMRLTLIPSMVAGHTAYFEVYGLEPAVVEIVRGAHGRWRLGQVAGVSNAKVSSSLMQRLQDHLHIHGVVADGPSPDDRLMVTLAGFARAA